MPLGVIADCRLPRTRFAKEASSSCRRLMQMTLQASPTSRVVLSDANLGDCGGALQPAAQRVLIQVQPKRPGEDAAEEGNRLLRTAASHH